MTAPNGPDGGEQYDAIVIGAGPIGAHVARELGARGKRVLMLEAGRASGLTYDSYRSYVDTFYTAVVKEPNAPYPQNASAPSPLSTDIMRIRKGTPDLVGYQVEMGPQGFGSTYLRSLGGTSLHWLGTAPRFLPNDFRPDTTYGVGVDWPITYDDLQDHYCEAEWSIGVAANKEDQERFGAWFPEGYDYPMERVPMSYSDQVIAKKTDGLTVDLAGQSYPVKVTSLAQARNSIPRSKTVRVGGVERNGYIPRGAVGQPELGQRCEGNASCIPICPVQAKYSALKTLAEMDRSAVTLLTQAIATRLHIAPNGRIESVDYLTYDAEGGPLTRQNAKATIYVLAGHAVENAKLLLASNAANSSDQVGRNLMDHPFFYTWALAPQSLGMFRGPGQTSGVESLRDGAFRRDFAAFRVDLGNWGWDIVNFPPDGDVTGRLAKNIFGRKLRAQLGDVLPRQLRIGFDVEQLPEAVNRVTISREYKDAAGCFRPVINYRISDYTWQSMVEAIGVSKAIYSAMGIPDHDTFFVPPQGLPDERMFRARDGKDYLLHFIGAGHHVGTHRMGTSRTNSVVDRHQRAWDHENLYVAGCGSMPTTGTANPTLTALAMTLMSTKHMLQQLR
jgi:choline dehydrogenase-like flavoprotein